MATPKNKAWAKTNEEFNDLGAKVTPEKRWSAGEGPRLGFKMN
jgi:hypothetical protein